jgi:hypothetical protein
MHSYLDPGSEDFEASLLPFILKEINNIPKLQKLSEDEKN